MNEQHMDMGAGAPEIEQQRMIHSTALQLENLAASFEDFAEEDFTALKQYMEGKGSEDVLALIKNKLNQEIH